MTLRIKKINTFKLNKFLINTLLNHNLYLGYSKNQLNTLMSYHLLGSRNNISIHNINNTFFSIKAVINICNRSWYNFGTLWVMFPKSQLLENFKLDNYDTLLLLRKKLFLWTEPWQPGFFKKIKMILRYKKRKIKYPSSLFYLQYTDNDQRIAEAQSYGIMTYYIQDTASNLITKNFYMNSNEITLKSNLYYCKLLLSTLIFHSKLKKKLFIL